MTPVIHELLYKFLLEELDALKVQLGLSKEISLSNDIDYTIYISRDSDLIFEVEYRTPEKISTHRRIKKFSQVWRLICDLIYKLNKGHMSHVRWLVEENGFLFYQIIEMFEHHETRH